ncbi:C-C Chemokine Receptor Type 1 [Manis pentadactyla]|nr:C-C Chemokine Receptor Type 1 [Manis pentadactyla]
MDRKLSGGHSSWSLYLLFNNKIFVKSQWSFDHTYLNLHFEIILMLELQVISLLVRKINLAYMQKEGQDLWFII